MRVATLACSLVLLVPLAGCLGGEQTVTPPPSDTTDCGSGAHYNGTPANASPGQSTGFPPASGSHQNPCPDPAMGGAP